MQRTFRFFARYVVAFLAILSGMSFIIHHNQAEISPPTMEVAAVSTFQQQFSQEDFLNLTPRKIREITGQKLSFKEVAALKMAQHKIKKALPPKGNGKTDWKALVSIIAGGLGCLMAPIGLFTCPFLSCGGALLGIGGVVFGIMGLKGPNRGLAIAGLIAGGVAVLLGGGIFALSLLGGG